MVTFEIDDLIGVLKGLSPYLIGVLIILILATIITMGVKKKKKPTRKLIRSLTWLGTFAGVIIIINGIIFGPMSTLITLATDSTQKVSVATTNKAKKVAEDIAENGFVLLKNNDDLLPLKKTKKLNLFGWSSINPIYGGAGSGGINELYPIVSLEKGLEDGGFALNKNLNRFYKNYAKSRAAVSIKQQNWDLPEPPANKYSKKLINQAKEFSDTAVITLSRLAGEGANDIPQDMSKVPYQQNSKDYKDFNKGQHYLKLSKTEKNMVNLVCHHFKKVIILYNGAYPFQLGFVNEHPEIKSVIWAPGPGNIGFEALGKILNGSVSPSGRTTDTFVYNLKKAPYYYNAEKTNYANKKLQDMTVHGFNAGKAQKFSPAFINYVENIYVGYKFYETAAKEQKINYRKTVQFPFGYGLSYTKFQQTMSNLQVKNGIIRFSVQSKNVGNVSGKDVIEVYYNPPYKNGGIEKASANLISYRKTKELQPGETQKITFTINEQDMASYDEKGEGAYILEKGRYEISINKNSHDVIASKNYEVHKTEIYNKNNKRKNDKVAAKNLLQDSEGTVTYLSRKDHFANYKKATSQPHNLYMPKKYLNNYHLNANYNPKRYLNKNDKRPVTNKNYGLKLTDLRGKSYDDPKWNKLLDQLTVKEMANTIALAGYQTPAIPAIGKVQNVDSDGPAAINNNFTHIGSIGFPIEVVIANTWSKKLAYEYGKIMGQMAKEMGSSGWYAPGMNTHRSAFTARNYEYFSEDGILSGYTAANSVLGAKSVGVYPTIKHFAMYDSNGKMVSAWATEQSIRENYLKPFEIAVKKGHANAAMASWAFLGNKWVGENKALNQQILRKEWGFRGFIVSDFFRSNGHGFMNADISLPNGVDAMLSTFAGGPNQVTYKNAPSNIKYMKRALHNILYTTVNSWVYSEDGQNTSLPTWKKIAYGIDLILTLMILGLGIMTVSKYRARKM